MEEIATLLKEYTAIVVACLAAGISVINLLWSTRLNEGRERRKILWERELNRFSELEDTAGRLVEDLLSYNIRCDEEREKANEKIQALRVSTGRFLRYPEVADSLRKINNSAGWYIARDMKHNTKEEYQEARDDVSKSFQALVKAIDSTLKNAPKRL